MKNYIFNYDTLKKGAKHECLNVLSLISLFLNVSHLFHLGGNLSALCTLGIVILCTTQPFKKISHGLHTINFMVHVGFLFVDSIGYLILIHTMLECILITEHHMNHYPKHFVFIKKKKDSLSWLLPFLLFHLM